MMNAKLLAAISLGLVTAACGAPYQQRQVAAPYAEPRAATASERNCLDYGFTPGNMGYDRCVQREQAARQAGRMDRNYAEGRLVDDARGACYDYGLERGTQRYDNCVTREVDARRYREQGDVYSPSRTSTTYTTYSTAPAYTPSPTYYPDQQRPAVGVAVSTDEFGFRYDGQGNRVDRNGRIIDPHSTTR
ncbi:MAG: hypothetical protein WCP68_14480 [Enhydrobacter sp.]